MPSAILIYSASVVDSVVSNGRRMEKEDIRSVIAAKLIERGNIPIGFQQYRHLIKYFSIKSSRVKVDRFENENLLT